MFAMLPIEVWYDVILIQTESEKNIIFLNS